MSFIKTPIKGMRDFLPKEMELREYVLKMIKETYTSFGYVNIETPCVEHIENLTSNDGGENEKLIFKILKRGEKLIYSNNFESLTDCGLRYDLTVPLARYYSNNINELGSPFKSLQIGYVWRADRPQKGRFRQFMQCDIDILGENSILGEIDLIIAMTSLLNKLKLNNYYIRINDRRILREMALSSGFNNDDLESVFISLDKLDKIGKDGVILELEKNNYNKEIINKYLDMFNDNKYPDTLINTEVVSNLNNVIKTIKEVTNAKVVFDPTLVRGMGYYTGMIFEISVEGFNGSIGGGGRYDDMIGKYAKIPVAACGLSIGFERLVTILEEQNFVIPNKISKKAYILDRDLNIDKLVEILKQAQNKREEGNVINVLYRNKNYKYQRDNLELDNYKDIEQIGNK